MDLVIVIDKSQYWPGQFSQLKSGVGVLLNNLLVGADQTHVGVVSYSSDATLHFNLVQYFTVPPMQNEVRAIQQDDSGTATALVSITLQPLCSLHFLLIHCLVAIEGTRERHSSTQQRLQTLRLSYCVKTTFV